MVHGWIKSTDSATIWHKVALVWRYMSHSNAICHMPDSGMGKNLTATTSSPPWAIVRQSIPTALWSHSVVWLENRPKHGFLLMPNTSTAALNLTSLQCRAVATSAAVAAMAVPHFSQCNYLAYGIWHSKPALAYTSGSSIMTIIIILLQYD